MSSPTSIPSGWIDGKPHHSTGADHIVINPATDEPVATVKLAGRGDVDTAVASARAAQPAWGRATPAERAGVLLALARALDAESDLLIAEEVAHTGKPVRLATEFDIPGSIDNVDFFAGVARNLEGKASGEYSGDHTSSIRREPVGVVGTITPWNYPLQMAVWKVIPALAAGCTVVIKPCELTPLTTLTLARLASEAGLPPGVLNVVTGPDANMSALIRNNDVAKVCFTGSVGGGKKIMELASGSLTRVTLELGGNDAAIILKDAILDDTHLDRLFAAIYDTTGQICMNAKRVYVHRSRMDELVNGLVARLRKVKLGYGLDPSTTMGPLHSPAQKKFVEELIAEAKAAGIPVVSLNSGIDAWKATGALAYFGQDDGLAGRAVGERLNGLKAKHTLCVIHERGNVGLEARCAGLKKTFTGRTQMLYADGTDMDAVTDSIAASLRQDPSIDQVVTLGAQYALAAVKAVKQTRGTVHVATFDLNKDLVAAIRQGKVQFAVDQQPYLQGYLAVDALWLHRTNGNVSGGGVAPVLTGPAFVTGKNVAAVAKYAANGTR